MNKPSGGSGRPGKRPSSGGKSASKGSYSDRLIRKAMASAGPRPKLEPKRKDKAAGGGTGTGGGKAEPAFKVRPLRRGERPDPAGRTDRWPGGKPSGRDGGREGRRDGNEARREGRSQVRSEGRREGPRPPAGQGGQDRPRKPGHTGQRPDTRPAARPASANRAPTGVPFSPPEPMRIAKAMARSGLCSRRDADRWIEAGRVSVNGRILSTPALDVKPGDRILVDGVPLPAAAPAQLWRYYKPRGLVTTHADPEGRPTVFDALPPEMPRVVSVGRLDFNTEGLLLLTNDGELARHLELPTTGWLRRYRVRAFGRITQAELDALKDGITVDGVRYGGVEATLDSVQAGNIWLTLGLREGKNREVRRILGALDLEVNRLIRISYGPFQLTDLVPGAVEPVKRRVLADQLGKEAERFGLTGAIEGYKARQAQIKRASGGGGDED